MLNHSSCDLLQGKAVNVGKGALSGTTSREEACSAMATWRHVDTVEYSRLL